MKKNKGFTLIELLAVIIILAVIALIATPTILNVIDNARRKAFEETARGYYNATRYLYDELYLKNERQDLNFTFEDGQQVSSNSNYKLEVSGEIPKGGMIYLSEKGEILVSIHNGRYCAVTNGMGQVSINEDIENCGYSPSECFTYSDFKLTTTVKAALNKENQGFEGMNDTLLQISGFDKENPSCKGIVIIPEEYEGRKVEGIKASAFSGNTQITSVLLPKHLKIIDNYVFQNASNLRQVIMSEELRSIGLSAFKGTSLNEITIPEKVVNIQAQAFSFNPLKKVNILNSMANITNTQASTLFAATMDIEEVYIGPNVQVIPQTLFRNRKIHNLIIENGLTSIGKYAFGGNKLTNVIIPDSVTTIGDYAFEKNTITSLQLGIGLTSIGNYAFQNNQLTSVTIPDNVQTIGASTFRSNQLRSLTLGNHIVSIGSNAFKNNQLPDDQAFIYGRNSDGTENKSEIIDYGGVEKENVVIPSTVKTIKAAAFQNSNLISVTIPSNVTTIEESAFAGNKLTNLIIEDGVTSIHYTSFKNNELPEDQALIYGRNSNGTENKSEVISYGGVKKENIVIPNGVITIGDYAFKGDNIISVTLPDSVEIIGTQAFYGNQLTNIIIPNNVLSIKASAFEDNQLAHISLGNRVQYIASGAFAYNLLTELTIPDSVTTIGGFSSSNSYDMRGAFQGNKLQSVVFGKNLKDIGDKTFFYQELTSIELPSTLERIGSYAFSGNKLTTINIPNTVKNLSGFDRNLLTDVIIPDSVTIIGENAFEGNQLTSVKLSNNITEIGTFAFSTNQLTNVTIPASVTNIDFNAFVTNNFPNRAAITIEGNATRFNTTWEYIGFPAE